METADDHRLSSVGSGDAGSDIDKLPSEILVHIFKFGTYSKESWYVDVHKPALHPWKVSRVCRFWRSIALSTPDLWTNIVIIESQHIFGRDIGALQLQLDRSRRCLLSLRFVGLGTIIPGYYSELRLERLKDTLRPHLHRVRHLKFPAGSWGLILPQADPTLPATSIFPSLREVEYTGDLSETDLNSIPSQQLTQMTLISMNHTDILSIIERSRLTVEVLIIRSPFPDYSQPISTPEQRRDHGIVLPRLKSARLGVVGLFLEETSHNGGDRWIRSAPMLEELNIVDPKSDVDLDSTTAFIQRSSSSSDCPSPLVSFTISYSFLVSYNKTSLESLFRAISTVTSLDIYFLDLDTLNIILLLLACTADDTSPVPEFCPSLRSIRLCNNERVGLFDLDKFDLGSLVKMVESRRLEKVDITIGIEVGDEDEIKDEDREAIRVLRERYEIKFV